MKRSIGSAGRWLLVLLVMAGCEQPDGTADTAQTGAAPAPLSASDEAAVREVFTTVVNAIRAQDWDTFTATFAEDAIFHPDNAAALQGRAAIREWVTAGPSATSTFDFTNVQVFGGGDLAYATSVITMAFEGMPEEQGKQLVVLRKDATGAWKTVAVSFNADTPMQADTTTAP